MPLFFPIAPNAREALDTEAGARTIGEARELARGPVALVSDWLRPLPDEYADIQGKADAGVARGFVQLYEDARGQPVLAVTYWKPGAEKPAPVYRPAAAPEEAAHAEDDTDDLYFTKPGAKVKRKKKAADPNQMDLFGGRAKGESGLGARIDVVEEEGDHPSPDEENP
jgi:hypothetical protein